MNVISNETEGLLAAIRSTARAVGSLPAGYDVGRALEHARFEIWRDLAAERVPCAWLVALESAACAAGIILKNSGEPEQARRLAETVAALRERVAKP